MNRSVEEGRQTQGANEAIRWVIAVKPLAVSVPADAVTVTDETTGADVTASTTTGQASVQAGKLVLPLVHSLTPAHIYRVACRYSDGTSTLEPYIEIEAER